MEKNSNYLAGTKCIVGCYFFMIFFIILPGYAWSLITSELSLTKFNTPATVKLEGAKAEYIVKVPIPDRWEVKELALRLSYINSTAIMKKRSLIMVYVNNYPVAQTALLPESPEGIMTVQIPVRLLKPGYNNLMFMVAQNFTDKSCSPDNMPEVWTVLDLLASELKLSYNLKEVPLSLNSVTSFLFDSRSYANNTVHIITENNSAENIKLATIAASGTALRFDYRSVSFTLGHDIKEGVDTILVGSTKFSHSILSQNGVQTPSAQMSISHLPASGGLSGDNSQAGGYDLKHGLIVLSGETPEQLTQTVQAFSLLSFPLSDKAAMTVDDVILPDITQYSGKSRIAPGKKYQFNELDFPTTTFQGYMPGSRHLSFSIPTGLLLMENRAITLSFNMAYAANMRADSTLVIKLNGQYISSISLNNVQGGWYKGYKVRLPLPYAKQGYNSLEFQASLVPLRSGNCELKETEHLALTIFDNSEISMPEVPFWAELPRLESLMDDGFPLAEYPDFRGTTLLIGDKSDTGSAAAINFMAMLCQKNGILPFGLSVTRNLPDQAADVQLLVVGSRNTIPTEIADAAGAIREISLPVHGRLAGSKKNNDWLQQQKEKYFPFTLTNKPEMADFAVLKVDSSIGNNKLLISEFESPFQKMRSIVLVTADTDQDLLAGVICLLDRSIHSELKGTLALVDFNSDTLDISTSKVGSPYYYGDTGSINWINYLSNSYPKLFFMVMIAALLLCAFCSMMLLRIHKRKRLRNRTSMDSGSVNK